MFALIVPVKAMSQAAQSEAHDMTLAENLAQPVVPQKAAPSIIRHIERIGKTFAKQGVEVKYIRKGEVADIIIPCDKLFGANATELLPTAYKYLSAFNALVKLPSLYKIVVVVNSDDSGSESYLEMLTEERAATIEDYFVTAFPGVEVNIIPYGMGGEEPRTSNNSIAGRASNRRVDFYIIPEAKTIDMARSGKL